MESITLIIDPILDPEAVIGLAPGLGRFWGVAGLNKNWRDVDSGYNSCAFRRVQRFLGEGR